MNLKDEYNKIFIDKLATELEKVEPAFKSESFIKSIINKAWEGKELKERMRFVANSLNDYLSFNYKNQVNILLKVAPEFRGLQGMVFPDFIQVFGLNDFNTSKIALENLHLVFYKPLTRPRTLRV